MVFIFLLFCFSLNFDCPFCTVGFDFFGIGKVAFCGFEYKIITKMK